MSSKHSPNGLRRARVEYAVIDGQLRGTAVLPGGRDCSFTNAAELGCCLELGPERLVLVDATREPADEDGLAALSPTERAIAKAALSGSSNREIAGALFYSVKSVEAYLTRVYRRLGIEGRDGLRAIADTLEDLELPGEQADLVTGGSTATTAATTRRVMVEMLLL